MTLDNQIPLAGVSSFTASVNVSFKYCFTFVLKVSRKTFESKLYIVPIERLGPQLSGFNHKL